MACLISCKMFHFINFVFELVCVLTRMCSVSLADGSGFQWDRVPRERCDLLGDLTMSCFKLVCKTGLLS